jgi:hypothetical protein
MLQASGSDAPSWRKKDASNNSLQLTKRGEEEEVTSPVKIKKDAKESDGEKARRMLDLGKEVQAQEEGVSVTKPGDENSIMQAKHVEN